MEYGILGTIEIVLSLMIGNNQPIYKEIRVCIVSSKGSLLGKVTGRWHK